jgi:hypothetical protein
MTDPTPDPTFGGLAQPSSDGLSYQSIVSAPVGTSGVTQTFGSSSNPLSYQSITGTTNAGQLQLPTPAITGTPSSGLVFPSTLQGQRPASIGGASPAFPFMLFTLIKFRDRWSVVDNQGASAKLNPQAVIASSTTIATIALPMPQNIESTTAPQWNMEDGNQVLSAAIDTYNGIVDSKYASAYANAKKNLAAILAPTLEQKINGNVANPKKQAFFQGIDAREFAFSWALTPQSAQEATTLNSIIQTFTKNSLPDITDPSQAFFTFPCEYIIQLVGVSGFPVFPESLVCTGVVSNYTSNGFEITTGGSALTTTLTLAFKETTIRTQTNPGI